MALPRVVALVGAELGSDTDAVDPAVRVRLAGVVELVDYETALADAESNPVEGVLAMVHPAVTGALVDRLSPHKPLKVVANYGVGVDHLALDELRARGIPASNTPGVLSGATADMAFALLMACARRIPECDRYCRTEEYTSYKNMLFLGEDVHHKTIGIVGMGRIGEEVAHRAKGFHMNILYHNRSARPKAEAALGARLVSLDTLLTEADYVVLTCPCTPETVDLIGKAQFEKMKRTASLINVARGAVVNTRDLVAALRSKRIFAAGLDVTEPEPLPVEHPLKQLDNVVLAPHRGSGTREAREGMVNLMMDNLLLGLAFKPLKTQCN